MRSRAAVADGGTDGAAGDQGQPLPAPPSPEITLRPLDRSLVERLESGLGVSPLLAELLASRGHRDPVAASAWLDGVESLPKGVLGETEAASVIRQSLDEGHVIAVHGDYDCDGVCSTALLTLALRSLGGEVLPRVPERSEGYGLSLEAIDALASAGAALLIAVDCGITSIAEIEYARGLGLGVVVIDHHRPRADGALPDATVAHPNLLDPTTPSMCATAVAAAVVREVAEQMGRDLPDLGIDELQALATVTDVMPLEGVNRAIVGRGLRSLSTTASVGLSALLDAARIDRSALDSRTLGFALGPRINAAGRVRAASAALELLLTDDTARAAQLAASLEAANVERREIQRETLIAAEGLLEGRDGDAGWVLAGDGWHPGVIGIVAGSIARRWHRPTVVLAVDGDEAVGSARSVPGFDVAAVLDECADLLVGHGGHSAAAGLTISTAMVAEFSSRFAEIVGRTLADELRRPSLVADVAVAPSELTLDFAEELERLEPFGQGNDEPLLLMRNVSCERPRRMGEGRHARFTLVGGSGSSSAVAFDTRSRIDVGWGERADVVGRLEVNRFGGREEPRFVVERAVPARRPELRLVGAGLEWLEQVSRLMGEAPAVAGRSASRTTGAAGRNLLGFLSSLGDPGGVALVAADSSRRIEGLRHAAASCDLLDWSLVSVEPGVLEQYEHLVLIDPPWSEGLLAVAGGSGDGWMHQAWTDAEIRFTIKVHEAGNDIEGRLRPFYSELREAVGSGADAVASALRGTGRRPRPPRQVAWMLEVLDEIGVCRVDLESLEVELGEPRKALSDSSVLSRSKRQLEEGRRFLAGLRIAPA